MPGGDHYAEGTGASTAGRPFSGLRVSRAQEQSRSCTSGTENGGRARKQRGN